jgi:hypothetical protein
MDGRTLVTGHGGDPGSCAAASLRGSGLGFGCRCVVAPDGGSSTDDPARG